MEVAFGISLKGIWYFAKERNGNPIRYKRTRISGGYLLRKFLFPVFRVSLPPDPNRMTPSQAEWLRLAGPDGPLPRDWPTGRSGRQSPRRVDMRIVFACLRQGWVRTVPQLVITEAGRAALAAYGSGPAAIVDPADFVLGVPA